ncbi:MAG TPA: hypothetical protein P5105_05130, partial [Victivallales bacterium]|nr:hypothetical protein [Victivallales bacterium]
MIDIKVLRENPQLLRTSCQRRGIDEKIIDDSINLDSIYREILKNVERIRSERNRLSAECKTNPDARIKVKELKEKLSIEEKKLVHVEKELNEKLKRIPNILSEQTPDGKTDKDNCEIRKYGELPSFTFKPRDH